MVQQKCIDVVAAVLLRPSRLWSVTTNKGRQKSRSAQFGSRIQLALLAYSLWSCHNIKWLVLNVIFCFLRLFIMFIYTFLISPNNALKRHIEHSERCESQHSMHSALCCTLHPSGISLDKTYFGNRWLTEQALAAMVTDAMGGVLLRPEGTGIELLLSKAFTGNGKPAIISYIHYFQLHYTLHYIHYTTLHYITCLCVYILCVYILCVHINPYLYHSVSRSTIYPQSSLLNNCHGRLSHAQPLYWKIWAEEDMTWRMPCHDTRQALWPGAHADAIGSHEDRSSPSLDMGFLPSLPPKNLLRQSERTCFGTSEMYDKGC